MFKSAMFKSALIAATLFFAAAAAAVEVDAPAPDFSTTDIKGATQSLAQYRGHIVVLEWNNPECPFVRKHYHSGNMQSVQHFAREHGVVWLSVNSSAPGKEGNLTAAEVTDFIAKNHAEPSAYLLDPEGKLGHLYGAKATPHMFIIDEKGVLVYAGAIDDTPTPDADDLKNAHNYVRLALDDLFNHRAIATAETRAYGCSVKY